MISAPIARRRRTLGGAAQGAAADHAGPGNAHGEKHRRRIGLTIGRALIDEHTLADGTGHTWHREPARWLIGVLLG